MCVYVCIYMCLLHVIMSLYPIENKTETPYAFIKIRKHSFSCDSSKLHLQLTQFLLTTQESIWEEPTSASCLMASPTFDRQTWNNTILSKTGDFGGYWATNFKLFQAVAVLLGGKRFSPHFVSDVKLLWLWQ